MIFAKQTLITTHNSSTTNHQSLASLLTQEDKAHTIQGFLRHYLFGKDGAAARSETSTSIDMVSLACE